MKNLKDLIKSNAISLSVVAAIVLVPSGIAIASNIGSSNSNEVAIVSSVAIESTQAETIEPTTEAITTAPTVAETQAPTQVPTVAKVVAEVVTEAPTVAYDPLKYFSYTLVNGTYSLTKINYYSDIPMTLEVPSTYNGIAVTSIGDSVLANIPITTFIIPPSITAVGRNICGFNNVNSTVTKIVCQGTTPFSLISLALSDSQNSGGCTIYVPDSSVEAYKTLWNKTLPGAYDKLIKPLSQY